MRITFRNNLTSDLAILSLNQKSQSVFNSLSKLATGLSIVKASDNPAGLVISEQLRSQVASLNQEIDNLSMNISKHQTVSGSVSNLRGQLNELRSLAVGAANSAGNSEEAQEAYETAGNAIIESYNLTVRNAGFNGRNTLDGSEGSLADLAELTGIDMSSPEGAASAIDQIDAAASELDQASIDIGSTQKYDLEGQKATLEVTRQNLVSAESQIRDLDFAREYSSLVGNLIGLQVSMAILSHSSLTSRSVVNLFNL